MMLRHEFLPPYLETVSPNDFYNLAPDTHPGSYGHYLLIGAPNDDLQKIGDIVSIQGPASVGSRFLNLHWHTDPYEVIATSSDSTGTVFMPGILEIDTSKFSSPDLSALMVFVDDFTNPSAMRSMQHSMFRITTELARILGDDWPVSVHKTIDGVLFTKTCDPIQLEPFQVGYGQGIHLLHEPAVRVEGEPEIKTIARKLHGSAILNAAHIDEYYVAA